MDTKNFRFSVSSVKSYINCGKKFNFEKITKVPPAPESSHYRWLGKVVHTSMYQSIARFNSDSDEIKRWDIVTNTPSTEDALKFFNKAWEGAPSDDDEDVYMKSLYPFEIGSKPYGRFWPNKNLAILNLDKQEQDRLEFGWKAVASDMVRSGVELIKGIHEVVQIEKELNFKMLERDFKGYIDILGRDVDGKLEFYDGKTSWRKPQVKDLEKDLQFIAYSVALRKEYDLDYYPVGYYMHLRSGSLVPVKVTDEIVKKSEKMLGNVFSNLEDDIYFDDFGGSLCAYCDFKHLCYGEVNANNKD